MSGPMTLMCRTSLAALALLTCATMVRAEPRVIEREHVVRRGQTLYSIARSYGVKQDYLASINRIQDPSRILAGERLVVPITVDSGAPAGAAAATAPFLWPVRGLVVSRYGTPRRTHRHQGLDISAPGGTPIHAAADGVVLSVEEQRGDYGRLVTVEHDDGLVSFYGHNMQNLVTPGQKVSAGDVIALVGRSGNARGDHVHFELRRDGVPVDPLPALPVMELRYAARETAPASPSKARR